jgi:hypothetical protein
MSDTLSQKKRKILDRRSGRMVDARQGVCPACGGVGCGTCGSRGKLWLAPDGRTVLKLYGRAGEAERKLEEIR